jgi:hypothetical protein
MLGEITELGIGAVCVKVPRAGEHPVMADAVAAGQLPFIADL